MPPKPEEIQQILDEYEATIEAKSVAKGAPAGCIICRRNDRKLINYKILQGLSSDRAIAHEFGTERLRIMYHKLKCLPNYGGGTFAALRRGTAQRKKLFPIHGSLQTQKKFILDELLLLRDEAMKENPIDRKEILNLAKQIDATAEEYRKAKDAAKRKQSDPKEPDLSDEFSAEQIAEMERVNKTKGSDNGRTSAN